MKNKNAHLPLHHGGQTASLNGNSVNAALEKTLNMVGLASTKAGSGEKERAYVVKQNSVLKGLLCIVILAMCVLLVVFSTVLELKVARRGLIVSEAVHHKKEQHDHQEVLKISLELQEALESEIEETQLVEEFRAFFEKAAGTSDNNIDKLLLDANVNNKIIEKIKNIQKNFVKGIEIRLGKVINRFQKKSEHAKQKVYQLAKAMGHEIDIDAKQNQRYQEKLQEFGVDQEYAETLEEQYEEENNDENEEEEEEGMTEEEIKEEMKKIDPKTLTTNEKQLSDHDLIVKKHKEEQEKIALQDLEAQLNQFFIKLEKLTLPTISHDKIPLIEKGLSDLLIELNDPSKETDLDLFAKKMEMLIQTHAPGVLAEKFNSEKHDSVVEFYQAFIEQAKLQPHKAELMDLFKGWKSPDSKLTANNVLAAIEGVAYKEQLLKIFDLLEGEDMDPSIDASEEGETSQTTTKKTDGEANNEKPVTTTNEEKTIDETTKQS